MTTDLTPAALAARILYNLADRLDQHATTTHPLFGIGVDRCMGQGWIESLLPSATRSISGMARDFRPHATQIAAEGVARAMLPPVTGTVAEYATRLRTLAA